MSKTRTLVVVSLCLISTACANSASHKVVAVEKSTDDYLSCSDIRIEKRKTQAIIDGVQRDKEDMSGADVVDGLLWFPFNVIAKQSNYSSATKAAESRIAHLSMLEAERDCTTVAGNRSADKKVSQQLQSLNKLYRDGLLSEAEYLEKREAALSQITETNNLYDQYGKSKTKSGKYSYKVASLAQDNGCRVSSPASEIIKDGPTAYYQVECSNMSPVVYKCEFDNCQPQS